MKTPAGLLLVLLTIGCAEPAPRADKEYLENREEEKATNERLKEVREEVRQSNINTASRCPIKIAGEPSLDGSTLSINLNNPTDKTVDGIRVGFYFYNNFNEPVNSELGNESFIGESQQVFSKGGKPFTWQVSDMAGATKSKAYIKQIHFTDGTTWEADLAKPSSPAN